MGKSAAEQALKEGIAGAPWIEVEGMDVLDPGALFEAAERNDTPSEWYGVANSIEIARGYKPGRAVLLMRRAQVEKLPKDALITITWHDGDDKHKFHGWTLVRSYSILPLLEDEKEAIVVAEFADVRAIVNGITEDGINPGIASGGYKGICQELDRLWRGMIDRAGMTFELYAPGEDTPATPGAKTIKNGGEEFGREITYPTFPDQVTHGIQAGSVPAWTLWCAVLRFLGFDAVVDPFQQRVTVIDCSKAFQELKRREPLIYDYADAEGFATSPHEMVVQFPMFTLRSNGQGEGTTESAFDRTNDQRLFFAGDRPVFTYAEKFIERDLPELKGGIGRVTIYDATGRDYTRQDNGFPAITEDDIAITRARAKKIARRWLTKHKRDIHRRQKHYSGIVETLPNPLVSMIRWRDYGDSGGPVTELHYGERPDPDRPYLIEAGVIGRGVWQVGPTEEHPKLSAAVLRSPRVSVVPLNYLSGDIAYDTAVPYAPESGSDTGGAALPAVNLDDVEGQQNYKLQPLEDASFRVHLHCMLSVSTADPAILDHENGMLLRLVVRRYRTADGVTTSIPLVTLTRRHWMIEGESENPYFPLGFVSAENVAGETVTLLRLGDWIEVRNESDSSQAGDYPIVHIDNAVLTFIREDMLS